MTEGLSGTVPGSPFSFTPPGEAIRKRAVR
jgi:hypothetical protein